MAFFRSVFLVKFETFHLENSGFSSRVPSELPATFDANDDVPLSDEKC